MKVKVRRKPSMSDLDELEKLLHQHIADPPQGNIVRAILDELRSRYIPEPTTPAQLEAWEHYLQHPDPATGVILVPGPGGRNCPGNGRGAAECCCDECDWFLECFPEYTPKRQK